jgi:hypothetical protein
MLAPWWCGRHPGVGRAPERIGPTMRLSGDSPGYEGQMMAAGQDARLQPNGRRIHDTCRVE